MGGKMSQKNKAGDLFRSLDLSSRVTGIGSVPFKDADRATELILQHCPVIPYAPQLIKRDFRENMFLQFHENLPCLRVNSERQGVFFDESLDKEEALAEFHACVADNDIDHFQITPEYAQGFYILLEKSKDHSNPFIKAQVTGPITYLLSVTRRDNRPLLYDDEFSEAVILGLAMKGLWQAREIRKTGKIPVILFDEPALWGLGSAFLPLSSERARFFLDYLARFIEERDPDLLIGLHCCGNTDWTMVFETPVDIVSFDAYGFGDKLILYPKEITGFIDRGGFLGFGIVPTSEYMDGITEGRLCDHVLSLLANFEGKGLPRDRLLENSLFTPSCGMGPLDEIKAKRVLELTSSLARQIYHPCGEI
jgi:hypothetical protein